MNLFNNELKLRPGPKEVEAILANPDFDPVEDL